MCMISWALYSYLIRKSSWWKEGKYEKLWSDTFLWHLVIYSEAHFPVFIIDKIKETKKSMGQKRKKQASFIIKFKDHGGNVGRRLLDLGRLETNLQTLFIFDFLPRNVPL